MSGVGYSARLKYLMLCGSPVIFPHKGYWEYNEFWYHLLKDKENIVFTGEPNLQCFEGYCAPCVVIQQHRHDDAIFVGQVYKVTALLGRSAQLQLEI